MKLSSYYDESTENLRVGKLIFHLFGIIVLISVLAFSFNMLTRPARTASEVLEQTLDGSNVIYQYELFYDQHNTIQATKKKIKNFEQQIETFKGGVSSDPDNWNYTEREEYSRLNTALMGVKNILAEEIGQYNSNSSKMNRTLFKGDNLPYKYDVDTEEPLYD